MALIVWRTEPGYMAEVTPPHTPVGEARTTTPLARDDMVTYLHALGVPMADIWDALLDAERS